MPALFHNGSEGDLPDDEFGLFEGTEYGSGVKENYCIDDMVAPKLFESYLVYSRMLIDLASINVSRGSPRVALANAYESQQNLRKAQVLPDYSLPENIRYQQLAHEIERRNDAFLDMMKLMYPGLEPLILKGDEDAI